MKKYILGSFLTVFALLLSVSTVFAHVSVKPAQVGVGAFQTFTVGVPNEKGVAATKVRLVIPEGLEHVSPNVKSGWKVDMVHEESVSMAEDAAGHDEHVVKEIIWTGNIPSGFREDFYFSAKVPADTTTVVWKAYQTYADGSVVSWELTPEMEQPKDEKGNPDYSKFGPASTTKVVNDLTQTEPVGNKTKEGGSNSMATVALVLSIVSLGWQFAKKS